MAKLFRGAFWVTLATLATNFAAKLNQHPRAVRVTVLVLLNLTGFFCFWILFYGLGLLLVPPSGHQDYKLMRFGAQFVSFVISLLLSIGLYNLVRGVVLAGKFASDKISAMGKNLKSGGTIVVEVPRKAVDATKRAVEGTVEFVKHTGAGVSKAVGTGIKKGAEVVREKGPAMGGAVLKAAQKTGEAVQGPAKKMADWSKENLPGTVRGIKGFAGAAFQKVSALFKKKA